MVEIANIVLHIYMEISSRINIVNIEEQYIPSNENKIANESFIFYFLKNHTTNNYHSVILD